MEKTLMTQTNYKQTVKQWKSTDKIKNRQHNRQNIEFQKSTFKVQPTRTNEIAQSQNLLKI